MGAWGQPVRSLNQLICQHAQVWSGLYMTLGASRFATFCIQTPCPYDDVTKSCLITIAILALQTAGKGPAEIRRMLHAVWCKVCLTSWFAESIPRWFTMIPCLGDSMHNVSAPQNKHLPTTRSTSCFCGWLKGTTMKHSFMINARSCHVLPQIVKNDERILEEGSTAEFPHAPATVNHKTIGGPVLNCGPRVYRGAPKDPFFQRKMGARWNVQKCMHKGGHGIRITVFKHCTHMCPVAPIWFYMCIFGYVIWKMPLWQNKKITRVVVQLELHKLNCASWAAQNLNVIMGCTSWAVQHRRVTLGCMSWAVKDRWVIMGCASWAVQHRRVTLGCASWAVQHRRVTLGCASWATQSFKRTLRGFQERTKKFCRNNNEKIREGIAKKQHAKLLYFDWSPPWHFKTARLDFMSAWSGQV